MHLHITNPFAVIPWITHPWHIPDVLDASSLRRFGEGEAAWRAPGRHQLRITDHENDQFFGWFPAFSGSVLVFGRIFLDLHIEGLADPARYFTSYMQQPFLFVFSKIKTNLGQDEKTHRQMQWSKPSTLLAQWWVTWCLNCIALWAFSKQGVWQLIIPAVLTKLSFSYKHDFYICTKVRDHSCVLSWFQRNDSANLGQISIIGSWPPLLSLKQERTCLNSDMLGAIKNNVDIGIDKHPIFAKFTCYLSGKMGAVYQYGSPIPTSWEPKCQTISYITGLRSRKPRELNQRQMNRVKQFLAPARSNAWLIGLLNWCHRIELR